MAQPVGDEQYALISVLYHALQGAETTAVYIRDAEKAQDGNLAAYFREVQQSYQKIAERGREILKQKIR
jgi:hypothetical protein